MNSAFKTHRETKEIGGSCVEKSGTESISILLDFGMLLVEKDGKEFDFRKYKTLITCELSQKRSFVEYQRTL